MEVDTDRQGADASLDNDPLMQAALANSEVGLDSSTPPANGADAYSQDEQIGEEQQQPAGKVETPPPAPPQPSFQQVPLAELLNERERRQNLQRKLEEIERRQQEAERSKQAPDPYLEPIKSAEHVFQSQVQQHLAPVLQQLQEQRLYDARQLAYQIHGRDKADTAIKAFDEQASPAERAQVMNSPNPFLASVEWHSRKRVLEEVGDDPQKYLEKKKADLLKDPAFLAEAIEAFKAQAQGNPQFTAGQRSPSNVTRLPSVAKVGTSAGITATEEADWTPEETIARLADPPRRRG